MQVMTVKPTEQWIVVTPDLAEEWLLRNTDNRRLVMDRVIRFATDMEEGRWVDYHPHGIAFDSNGRLMDGQHRLEAVRLSGVPIRMRVTMDLPPEMHSVFDLGVPRTGGEVLRRSGVRNSTQVAVVATMLYWYDTFPDTSWNSARHPSKTQVLDLVQGREELFVKATGYAESANRYTRIPRGQYGTLYLLAERHGLLGDWDVWHESIASGVGLSHGDARLTLRNYFAHDSRRRERRDQWHRQRQLGLVLTAYRAWREDRPVKILRFEQSSLPMPTIV